MNKILLAFIFCATALFASEYSHSSSAAKDALKKLDCEFEDCTPKPALKPKVVEKVVEKVVIKEVPVEKIVEKVVIKEVPVEKVVTKELPPQKVKPIATDGITFSRAYFDIHPKSQAPILEYIDYSQRASFDVNHYVNTVKKIKETVDVFIHGNILVPEGITTNQVYINVGPKFYHSYYSYWKKEIFYNGSDIRQNAEDFLADVKTDAQGRRYVDYKIKLHLDQPWKLQASEQNVAPNTFFFKVSPKIRGFQDKFQTTKIFVFNE
jgi:hypothetical protein